MDPSTCREQMALLITEQTEHVSRLAELLEREHALLVHNDVAALDPAMRERQRYVARILHIEEEWRGLCRGLGYAADPDGLASMLRWCDPGGSLTAAWSECAAAAARCRQNNDRNGILVSARLQQIQARLGTLIQAGRNSMVYGRHGTEFSGNAGRVVAAQA